MLGDEPKATSESSGVLQPKVMTASELEELKKEAQVTLIWGPLTNDVIYVTERSRSC